MRDRRMGVGCAMPAIADPLLWRHLIGRNVETCGADHTVWGTDCLWWGSRQWGIDTSFALPEGEASRLRRFRLARFSLPVLG